MRFFVALEIPETSRSQIQAVQAELSQIIPSLRLTDPEKLHLTIAFIGEQSDTLTEDLVSLINRSTQGINSFSITPAIIDGFPNIHSPHTLFLGVTGDLDKLLVLRERIKDGLVNLGIDIDERRFVPHIAIGKLSENKISPSEESQIQELVLKTDFDSISTHSIKLFQSLPEENFHRHNTLAEINLT